MNYLLDNPASSAEIDFREIKQRFFTINQARLQRIRADLRGNQLDFLRLLPLLFHINHPMLPGYVSRDTPAGIPQYNPHKEVLQIARRLAKSFEFKKKAYRKFDIQGIYLMGSSGTVAYSDKSDFDIWICHDPQLALDRVRELEIKLELIQDWSKSFGIDANLYLVNPEKIQRGEFGYLSNESSGSALHTLLLEEFYRTGVLLEGRYPLWWVVPPDMEANYAEYVADIKLKRYIHSKEHIDFGGLTSIKPEEFYGATLWLLYKSINAPYKSILKILLMQTYATEFPHIDLLGMRYKRAVYAGEENIEVLDPYVMMLEKVEDFLRNSGDEDRLQLARRSFYYKVNERLSNLGDADLNWRQQLLSALAKKWRWNYAELVRLDLRGQWKIKQVMQERNALIAEFKNSYRFLSNFARQQGERTNLIRQSDLNVLGRKLYAAFERKAGKVDLVYQGITKQLHESHISLHKFIADDDKPYWVVFSGVVAEKDASVTEPLKRSFSLVELVCWCYFNRVINKNTVIGIYNNDSDLTNKEIKQIVDAIEKQFPEAIAEEGSIEDYRQPAQIVANITLINVGVDPLLINRRDGMHIASDRTDALKYSSRFEYLVTTIDQVLLTSWQEILIYSYSSVDGLMKCLQDYMQWAPPSSGRRPPLINARSFSSYRGTSISRRVETLFTAIYECFYTNRYAASTKFVLGVEKNYYILRLEDDNLRYEKANTMDSLYYYLAQPNESYAQYTFDNETLAGHVLPLIYSKNIPGIVQCFYEYTGDSFDVYILDEKGTLSHHVNLFYDVSTLIGHYNKFFESVHNRMHFVAQQSSQEAVIRVDDIQYFLIQRDHAGHKVMIEQKVNKYARASHYSSLQVIGDLVDGKPHFTLFYDEQEFSMFEYGEQLYEAVVKNVLAKRKAGKAYDIYITDIDLSPALLYREVNSIQTSRYLEFKNQIENQLKRAMLRV